MDDPRSYVKFTGEAQGVPFLDTSPADKSCILCPAVQPTTSTSGSTCCRNPTDDEVGDKRGPAGLMRRP